MTLCSEKNTDIKMELHNNDQSRRGYINVSFSYFDRASKTSDPERIRDFRDREKCTVGSHLDFEATLAFENRKSVLARFFFV